MLTDLRRRAVRDARRGLDPRRDSGLSLIEVIVSIALIGIAMGTLTPVIVASVSATSRQGNMQVAAQLADDAADKVRSLKGSALVAGRDKSSSDAQWATPVTGVAPYLVDSQETWDPTVTTGGVEATLPTTGSVVSINGVHYVQNWYLGRCWQPKTGGACALPDAPPTSTDIGFLRVVVAVTWPDRHCAHTICSYVTSTLVSDADEQLFDAGSPQ